MTGLSSHPFLVHFLAALRLVGWTGLLIQLLGSTQTSLQDQPTSWPGPAGSGLAQTTSWPGPTHYYYICRGVVQCPMTYFVGFNYIFSHCTLSPCTITVSLFTFIVPTILVSGPGAASVRPDHLVLVVRGV